MGRTGGLQYKAQFREAFEKDKKLSVSEQTALLHQVIHQVVDVDDPRGLKMMSRSELNARFPYQDVDDLIVGIHGDEEDQARYHRQKQTLKRMQAKQGERPQGMLEKLKRFFQRGPDKTENVIDLDEYRV